MLSIKSITSCNIDGLPLLSSNLSKRMYEYKKYISENLNENYEINENELCIVCIQGLYGYRSGLLGYISNLCSYKLSQYSNPNYLQKCVNYVTGNNFESNDYEISSYLFSLISRAVPILNIGNWDFKQKLFSTNKILTYISQNYSLPSIFNLSSVYLLEPLFDSGCSIYSNKKDSYSGFENWNILKNCEFKYKLFNSGINWSFFESENKKSGIMIIGVNILCDTPEWVTVLQIKQIVALKEKLELRFVKTSDYEIYDTFITGDFSVLFNLRNILDEVNILYKIFEDSGLKIINDCESSNLVTSTNFILHNYTI